MSLDEIKDIPIGNIAQSQKYVAATRSISNENITKLADIPDLTTE